MGRPAASRAARPLPMSRPDDEIRAATYAMGTRFEILLRGAAPERLRAAADQALQEITELDSQLSRFNPLSDVTRLNALSGRQAIGVNAALAALLAESIRYSKLTGGAFDVTVGPLVQLWRGAGETGVAPSTEELQAARDLCGANILVVSQSERTARLAVQGACLDLGAIGKGYAIDRAVCVLRDCGVREALIHGGSSTCSAFSEAGPASAPWLVRVQHPHNPERGIAEVRLESQALSVSAPHGRLLWAGGREWGHVLDPRTGLPAGGARLSAVRCSSALASDALSTALLVMGLAGVELAKTWPGLTGAWLVTDDGAVVEWAAGDV